MAAIVFNIRASKFTMDQCLKRLLCRSAKQDAAAQHMRTLLAVAASDAAVVSVWDMQVRAKLHSMSQAGV